MESIDRRKFLKAVGKTLGVLAVTQLDSKTHLPQVESAQNILLAVDKPFKDKNLQITNMAPNFDVAVNPQQLQYLRSLSELDQVSTNFYVVLPGSFSFHHRPGLFQKEGAVQIFPNQMRTHIYIGLDSLNQKPAKDQSLIEYFNQVFVKSLCQASIYTQQISQGASEETAYQISLKKADQITDKYIKQLHSGQTAPVVVINPNNSKVMMNVTE